MTEDDEALIRAHTRSREDFVTLAEAMPHLVWMAAPDGEIAYFNQRWTDYSGIETRFLPEQDETGLLHPDDFGRMQQLWSSALSKGTLFEAEYRLRGIDGTYRWFLARACPILDEHGAVSRWIGTATDIDQERRTNDSLRFIVDCANELANHRESSVICSRLAQLATQRFADWCFVTLSEGEGRYRVAALSHRDPERLRFAQAYWDQHPVRSGSAIAGVIAKKRTLMAGNVDAGAVLAEAVDDEHRAALEALHIRSVLVVPIATADGPAHGALALFSSELARNFGPADAEIAETVARQAAGSLENAAAFEQERSASRLLRFVSGATQCLSETFDVTQAVRNVLDLAVREIADIAYVWSVEDGRALRLAEGTARDESVAQFMRALVGERPLRPRGEKTILERISGEPYVLRGPEQVIDRSHFYEFAYDAWSELNMHSIAVLPLSLHGAPAGALVFARTESPLYTERDLDILRELGRHVTLAYSQAELFARERRISTELQRAMLPRPETLPQLPGLSLDVAYHPSAHDSQVGGDWYDALCLPDGSLVVSVGDVTGRGLGAAGLMGKLRQALGVVPLYERDPARMLDAVDLLLRQRGFTAVATAFLGVIDPDRRSIRYASAGHPPPLLRRNGVLESLSSSGLPLGLRDQSPGESATASLDGAELLVLFTDGLIESTRDLAQGEALLHDVLMHDAVMFVRSPAKMLCDACLPPDAPDDAAVLTLQVWRGPRWSFDAENARAAHDARADFMAYLRNAGAQGDFNAAELIFGELIGNVVRHAPGGIEVQLEWRADHPVLHVTDRGSGFDRKPALPRDVMKESGRGLFIVESLSHTMEVEYISGYGSHICVVLPLRITGSRSMTDR